MNVAEYHNLKSKYGTINETRGAVKNKKDVISEIIEYILKMMDAFNLVVWIPSGVVGQVKKNLVKLDKSTLCLILVLMGMLKIGIEDEFKKDLN